MPIADLAMTFDQPGGADAGQREGTSVYTRDPDGNLIEFMTHPASGRGPVTALLPRVRKGERGRIKSHVERESDHFHISSTARAR